MNHWYLWLAAGCLTVIFLGAAASTRRLTRHFQDVCRCGDDDDEHKGAFFLERACQVAGCPCEKFTFSHSERRET